MLLADTMKTCTHIQTGFKQLVQTNSKNWNWSAQSIKLSLFLCLSAMNTRERIT